MKEFIGRIDKTLVASVVLHLLVFGWGLFTFSSKALEVMPEDSVAVDVISDDQLAKAMAGSKAGKKENPKPKVEKVAEAKPPVEDAVGKIDDKKAPVITETAPQEQPKPVEKPVEKKPEPPKPVVEKPKEEPKPPEPKHVEKKPEPKVDPIAEAIKQEQKKPPPKPQQQAATPPPQQQKKAERVFDQSKIAALIDKRDPTRNSVTGSDLNPNEALGLAKGNASNNVATWGAMFKSQVERCWKKPYGGVEAQFTQAIFSVKLRRDGTLEATPTAISAPTTPYFRVYQESALRAIIECQPYKLPMAFFEEWKFFEPVFTERGS